MGEFKHISVLLKECIEGLSINPDGIYVDATTGGGGHSIEIVKSIKGGRLICIDRDEDALKAADKRLSGHKDKVTFLHGNFKDLKVLLKQEGIEKIDGALFDLGVSSYQLDEANRGFSYMADAPLDMRMDRSEGITAKDVVNTYDIGELIRIFREYGEEKFAKRIAENICKARETKDIETTGELVKLVADSVPKNLPGGHPAKRVFQALRIEVNEELSGLYDFFYELPDICNEKARICVITFHSLEDRAVKQAFKKAFDPCICPKEFPVCTCGRKPKGKIITRKPILPSALEMEENKRSKSAKLRIFETGKLQ